MVVNMCCEYVLGMCVQSILLCVECVVDYTITFVHNGACQIHVHNATHTWCMHMCGMLVHVWCFVTMRSTQLVVCTMYVCTCVCVAKWLCVCTHSYVHHIV